MSATQQYFWVENLIVFNFDNWSVLRCITFHVRSINIGPVLSFLFQLICEQSKQFFIIVIKIHNYNLEKLRANGDLCKISGLLHFQKVNGWTCNIYSSLFSYTFSVRCIAIVRYFYCVQSTSDRSRTTSLN